MMQNQPRFVLYSRQLGLDETISEHPTFTEAEEYQKSLGRSGKHVDMYIVDRSRNVVADASAEEDAKKLATALALEAQRKALMDIQEENLKRAEDLKNRQAALEASAK